MRSPNVIASLVTAFTADPIVRWFLPHPEAYLRFFPEVVTAIGAEGFAAGTVDEDGDAGAASVWLPPGASPDEEAFGSVLERSVDPARADEIYAFLGQMEAHHPADDVWHLFFIGVDPRHQGRCVGTALLRRGIDRADADGRPAYLEASTPRNRSLYERHGFEVIGEIQVADSPPMWPMLRPAT